MSTNEEPTSQPAPAIDSAAAALREQVTMLMSTMGLNNADLARLLGVSRPAVSLWRSDTSPQPKAEAAMRVWVTEMTKPWDGYIATPSAKRIVNALAYAQGERKMVHIYGGPGVGKTTTLRNYAAEHERVTIATMSPSSSGLVSCLAQTLDAFGVVATGGALTMRKALGKKLGPGDLLIVDEAQQLLPVAIEELRSLHDAVRCGLAWVGNEMSYARLTGGNRNSGFAQISSRIAQTVALPRVDEDDVTSIAEDFGVTDEDAILLLIKVARQAGALRLIVNTLEPLKKLGRPFTVDNIRRSLRFRGQEDS